MHVVDVFPSADRLKDINDINSSHVENVVLIERNKKGFEVNRYVWFLFPQTKVWGIFFVGINKYAELNVKLILNYGL